MPSPAQVLRCVDYYEYVVAWQAVPEDARPRYNVHRIDGEWQAVDHSSDYLGVKVMPTIAPNAKGRYAGPGWHNARWPDGKVYTHWRPQLRRPVEGR